EKVISRWEAERVAGSRLPFAVRSAVTGELLGGCELRPEGSGVGGISYWTYPPHRKKGVATRAVRLLSELAFQRMGLRRLELLIDSANTASRRVAAATRFRQVGERDGKLRFALHRKDFVVRLAHAGSYRL